MLLQVCAELLIVNKFVALNLSMNKKLALAIDSPPTGIVQVLNHSSVAHTEEIIQDICSLYHEAVTCL